MLALAPDVVIVATGGLPQNPPLDAGDELVTSSWDIIAGAVKPAENVLLYDDNGGHQGMTARRDRSPTAAPGWSWFRRSASSRRRWAA